MTREPPGDTFAAMSPLSGNLTASIGQHNFQLHDHSLNPGALDRPTLRSPCRRPCRARAPTAQNKVNNLERLTDAFNL
jgi:hypothetical protein